MKIVPLLLLAGIAAAITACGSDDPAPATTTAPAAYSWSQFAQQYQGPLSSSCNDSDRSAWLFCISSQAASVQSMTRSARDLPVGKPRSDLQNALIAWEKDRGDFESAHCGVEPAWSTNVTCIGDRATIPTRWATVQAIVKRQIS